MVELSQFSPLLALYNAFVTIRVHGFKENAGQLVTM